MRDAQSLSARELEADFYERAGVTEEATNTIRVGLKAPRYSLRNFYPHPGKPLGSLWITDDRHPSGEPMNLCMMQWSDPVFRQKLEEWQALVDHANRGAEMDDEDRESDARVSENASHEKPKPNPSPMEGLTVKEVILAGLLFGLGFFLADAIARVARSLGEYLFALSPLY